MCRSNEYKPSKYKPIADEYPHMLHGADYNPEQWMHIPNIWDEDMKLMDIAGINVTSIGIFSWSTLEPEEGVFNFEWLDKVMDMLAANNRFALLATSSGARPGWMSAKYPEVLRVREDGLRNGHGVRHNHCSSSPVYRDKVKLINRKLAQRYKDHKALLGWHISNEYYGECHCELCKNNFREWLKNKYNHNLDGLNKAWWTKFWSHDYSTWEEINPPSTYGETSIDGLDIDWKRFVVDQTVDFMRHEIEAIKEYSLDKPVTTNFHGMPYPTMNYWKFAKHLDVISWDIYPEWSLLEDSTRIASDAGFVYDLARSLKKGQPFMLMESTPSTCWINHKQQRPGIQLLSSMQAVAHGSDTVQYFQWRKGLGGCEKFHGAVVGHDGSSETKTFKEVAEVGALLTKLDDIVGTTVSPEVAIIYDWENHWAIDKTIGLQSDEYKQYLEGCQNHYYELWKKGIEVDVIDSEEALDSYKVVVAPMLYMLKPKAISQIKAFVNSGGTLITTYWTGMVDENSLCFMGGFPGPLREVCGIYTEENDGLNSRDEVLININHHSLGNLSGDYVASLACDVIHAESAQVLGEYKSEYYSGKPALTRNNYGKGLAYHIAFRGEPKFLDEFYADIITSSNINTIDIAIPSGVSIRKRSDGNISYLFIMNFTSENKKINIGDLDLVELVTNEVINSEFELDGYSLKILKSEIYL